jgi:hypothetical protein
VLGVLNQVADQGRADETSAASDKNAHVRRAFSLDGR